MSTMDVSVTLRLLDQLSAPAKKATEAVRALTKAATELKKIGGGMTSMSQQIKASASSTASSSRQMAASITSIGQSAANAGKAVRSGFAGIPRDVMQATRQVVSGLNQIQKAKERAMRPISAARAPSNGGQGVGMGLYGGYYAAHMVGHATKTFLDKGANLQSEEALLEMGGYSPAQRSRMMAAARNTMKMVPTSNEAQNVQRLRELNYALGNRLDMAIDTLPDLSKLMTVINASQGAEKAGQIHDQIIESVKGAEIKNLIDDEPTFRRWLNFQGKSVLATGGLVQPTSMFQTFKYARSAVHGWTEDFFPIVSELTQEMMTGRGGGSRGGAGVSLANFKRMFVDNQYDHKHYEGELRRRGLLGQDGKIVDGKLAAQNPFAWMMKNIMPAMARDHVNLNDHAAIVQWMGAMGGTDIMKQLLALMVIQRNQIQSRVELYKQSMGYEEAYSRAMDTFATNVEALSNQTTQLQASFAKPLLGPATKVVKGMTNIASWLSDWARGNPKGTLAAEGLLGGGFLMALRTQIGRKLIGSILGGGLGLLGGGPMGGMLGGWLGQRVMGGALGRAAGGAMAWISPLLSPAMIFAGLLETAKLSQSVNIGKFFDDLGVSAWTKKWGDDIVAFFQGLPGRIAGVFSAGGFSGIGKIIMDALLSGLQSAADSVISWVTGFVARLKSLFSFSASPTITPNGGGYQDPLSAPGIGPKKSSYFSPQTAPALMQHAGLHVHGDVHISVPGSGDPHATAEAVWRRFNAAVSRQLSDGAFA